jgi:threonine dehydrogenase-like Zn-dependent dehydrogenase
MATQRGATLVAPFEVRLEEMPRPTVDADDVVILRNEGIGICGSNLHWWYGGGPATGLMTFPMPGAGGHEYAGTVIDVGRAVTRVKPGDRSPSTNSRARAAGRALIAPPGCSRSASGGACSGRPKASSNT